MLLNFCLIFCPFQPGVAYKNVAYKKTVYALLRELRFAGIKLTKFRETNPRLFHEN